MIYGKSSPGLIDLRTPNNAAGFQHVLHGGENMNANMSLGVHFAQKNPASDGKKTKKKVLEAVRCVVMVPHAQNHVGLSKYQ